MGRPAGCAVPRLDRRGRERGRALASVHLSARQGGSGRRSVLPRRCLAGPAQGGARPVTWMHWILFAFLAMLALGMATDKKTKTGTRFAGFAPMVAMILLILPGQRQEIGRE